MTTPYTVSLQDCEALPTSARIKAECIFAQSLERQLGGAEVVATTYRAWIEASEMTADVLTAEATEQAVKWPRAAQEAERSALRDLGHFDGTPHFEVRLAKVAA